MSVERGRGQQEPTGVFGGTSSIYLGAGFGLIITLCIYALCIFINVCSISQFQESFKKKQCRTEKAVQKVHQRSRIPLAFCFSVLTARPSWQCQMASDVPALCPYEMRNEKEKIS